MNERKKVNFQKKKQIKSFESKQAEVGWRGESMLNVSVCKKHFYNIPC